MRRMTEYEKHHLINNELKVPSLELKRGKAIHRIATRNLLNHVAIKKLAKEHNKRVSEDFFACLERHVREKIVAACKVWNGNKKTLDASTAGWIRIAGDKK